MPKLDTKVTLYIAEEQPILREAYQSFFEPHPDFDVVGVSGDTDADSLASAAATFTPRVVLVGIKLLSPTTAEVLERLREASPETAIVLLSAYYDIKGITTLRQFSAGKPIGCAYLLKHTIDTVEQLTQVVQSVSEGRIIVDPTVIDGLMATSEKKTALLKDLSPRELEVLSWMAKGFRNGTIAEVMCLESKTVERHINNIYSKLGDIPTPKDQRIHAVTTYLRGTGQLPEEEDWVESF
jgi:DNA-binding NarL/FixJ family response regulator